MDLLWWSVIIGSVLGIVMSVVFGVYSKSTANSYARNIFGMTSTALITNAIIIIIGASFIFLATVSGMVRDLSYPNSNPLNFTIETILMAVMSSSIIFIMTVLRGKKINATTWEEFALLLAKFGSLHILLQFSGFYSYVFG